MPSQRLGFLSGGTNILSGNYFSGQGSIHPVGGIQLRAASTNSGLIYVGLSGGVTTGSGVFQQSGSFLSGLGKMDGIPLGPGDPYLIPKVAFAVSGSPGIFIQPDVNCSGQAVVFFEIF
jgi:hypothetical protein